MNVYCATIDNKDGSTEIELIVFSKLLTKMMKGDSRVTAYISAESARDAATVMAEIAELVGPWPDISNIELLKLHDKGDSRKPKEEATYQAALRRPKKKVYGGTTVGFGDWCFEVTAAGSGSNYPGWEVFRPWKEHAIAALKEAISRHKNPPTTTSTSSTTSSSSTADIPGF